MATKILERSAFVGGRLFQAGDEIEVAASNPNILIAASSSPIGNLTLAQVAVFLRYKAEEAGEDLEALIYPEGVFEAAASPAPAAVEFQADPAPAEVAIAAAADADNHAFVPFDKRTKAELIDYLGSDSPAPDGATKATLIEAAEKKHAATQAG